MTDVLDDVEELLSTQETAPIPAAPVPKSATCPECGQVFLSPFENVKLGNHRRHAHDVAGTLKPSGKKPAPKKTAATGTATSRARSAPRKPLGESLAKIFLQAGRLINTVVDPPTGAAIMFEAGALGAAVDAAIAGTIIDRPLQKGAGIAEKFEPLVPLVTMPAMIFMLSKNPNMQPMIEGELREALEDVLVQSLPLLRKRAARTRATVDALAELQQLSPELAQSDDPIRDILDSFFAPPVPEPVSDADQ